jgi:hypothetical protein
MFLSGCRSEYMCGDLWDSPTVKAKRALIVVPAGELKILRVDGRNVGPYEVCEAGEVRRYLIPTGEHTITAAFRYAAPVSNGLLGEVHGHPLKLTQFFAAGREYTAAYQIHPYDRPEPRFFLEVAADALFTPVDYYWSLELVERARAGTEPEPKVGRTQSCRTQQGEAVDATPQMGHPIADRHEDVTETVARILTRQRRVEP